jgi:hypothetical protein
VEDAQFFAESLRDVSRAPVMYAELRGAQHAFDIFPSPRTARMLDGTLRFLTAMRERAKTDTHASIADGSTRPESNVSLNP